MCKKSKKKTFSYLFRMPLVHLYTHKHTHTGTNTQHFYLFKMRFELHLNCELFVVYLFAFSWYFHLKTTFYSYINVRRDIRTKTKKKKSNKVQFSVKSRISQLFYHFNAKLFQLCASTYVCTYVRMYVFFFSVLDLISHCSFDFVATHWEMTLENDFRLFKAFFCKNF